MELVSLSMHCWIMFELDHKTRRVSQTEANEIRAISVFIHPGGPHSRVLTTKKKKTLLMIN